MYTTNADLHPDMLTILLCFYAILQLIFYGFSAIPLPSSRIKLGLRDAALAVQLSVHFRIHELDVPLLENYFYQIYSSRKKIANINTSKKFDYK